MPMCCRSNHSCFNHFQLLHIFLLLIGDQNSTAAAAAAAENTKKPNGIKSN
jgi:hypothetical protein